MRAATVMTVQDTAPLGEVVLTPDAITGMPQARLARAMAERVKAAAPDSGAEALSLLRRLFPDSPLAERVAALAALTRK